MSPFSLAQKVKTVLRAWRMIDVLQIGINKTGRAESDAEIVTPITKLLNNLNV